MDNSVVAAILRTLKYADLFDYAMTPDQVHRYLIGVRASRADVEAALNDRSRLNGNIARTEGYLTLPRRGELVAARVRLRTAAQHQFPRARFYARLLAYLPFVRMVAITGGLAMENARDGDTDFFIVTEPGRLWLVRGVTVALVRLARLWGDHLCPNLLLCTEALTVGDRNLYTAHEVVQMVPVYGLDIYCRIRALNDWTRTYLPNADNLYPLDSDKPLNGAGSRLKRLGERALGGRLGNGIERWEMRRKIAKLSLQIPKNADDVTLSAEACRGFFSGHGRRVLAEFQARER